MPELPEVETICRGLAPQLSARHIIGATQYRANLRFPLPPKFTTRLKGRTISTITRRGKFILIHLDKGLVWLIHLGMSGRLRLWPPHKTAIKPAPHDHVRLRLDNGATLIYTDPRRFGYMDLLSVNSADELAQSKYFIRMGPEPLSPAFDADLLGARLANRKTAIKTALMDQTIIAGLGNIYACEALFRAHISPRRRAGYLGAKRIKRLAPAICAILQDAIAAGGTSLRDFVAIDGKSGYFQYAFDVYGRDNLPCPNRHCNATIARIVQAGRSSFFCPACQR